MKRKILIVDDEEDIRSIYKIAFKSDEVDVIEACNGEEALKIFQETGEFDLVITDMKMPKMEGNTLFFELKKQDPFIQIVMITGYPTLQSILEMLEAGASDFIIKPFDIELLKKIVLECFGRIDRLRNLKKEWLIHKKKMKDSQK